ncbi:MAG: VanW family protein [Peptococcaceae bacterium]|jgi:vancomycin resistance protein YoaR|nr:VanW family protein [Peptococcaceae bacterium]
MLRKRYLFILFLLVQAFFSVGVGVAVAYSLGSEESPYSLRVGQLDLAGKKQEEAWIRIEQALPSEVEIQGRTYPLETIRSSQSIQDWLNRQYRLSETSLPKKLVEFVEKFHGEKSLDDLLLREEIVPQLTRMKADIDRWPVAARFSDLDGSSEILPEEAGYTLDVEASWQQVKAHWTEHPIALIGQVVEARPAVRDLEPIQDLLGEYATYYNAYDGNRAHNLRLAAQSLNNVLLAPGEEFSFNDTLGERTPEAGYKTAIIYADQSMLTSYGGGICQDASTLYQAVRQAKLPVTERHTHTLPVGYVSKGEDATVAYGVLDFRFRNDTDAYVLIRAAAEGSWLTISVLGQADENHPVQPTEEKHNEVWRRNAK